MRKVTLLTGDGIGPEISQAVIEVFNKAKVDIEFEPVLAGQAAFDKYGSLLPEETIQSIQTNKVALKAPLTTPIGGGFRSVNVELRKRLNLYANIRPCKSIEGITTKFDNVDLVIVRENTEGLYSGIEHYIGDKIAAETIKVITREASEKVANVAFNYAVDNERKLVTVVHKANIQKFTDGLFLDTAMEVAEEYTKEYNQIKVNDRIIDNMTMQLVMYPERYDILLCPNFYGDILSDLCAGLVGGLGVAPGANIGRDYAVFEAVHGTAPDIAGKDIANPTALLLSSTMMLRHLGMTVEADRIEDAIYTSIKEGDKTKDLGGSLGLSEYTQKICDRLRWI